MFKNYLKIAYRNLWKKQFLLVIMIFTLCICFCSLNGNKLKACDANAAVCGVMSTTIPVIKETVKKVTVEYVDETDMPLNYLMNPFIPM